MYVLSGKLHVEQNGHHVLTQDKGIVMRLMDKHKYYTDKDDICDILWMHFNGRQTGFFIDMMEKNRTMPAIFSESRVPGLIRYCLTVCNDDSSEREFLISETIYSIILTVLRSINKENMQLCITPRSEFMNRAIGYIERNTHNKITLREFAQQFDISPFHFCRIFGEYFHMTPMRYVMMRKIEISKYMLIYTNDSIADISNSLSFTDQSHFTRTFRNFEKQTPLAYRKVGR